MKRRAMSSAANRMSALSGRDSAVEDAGDGDGVEMPGVSLAYVCSGDSMKDSSGANDCWGREGSALVGARAGDDEGKICGGGVIAGTKVPGG